MIPGKPRDLSILADALPDLVVGLMGVPVAFSIQTAAEKFLNSSPSGAHLRAFVGALGFLVGLYFLHSIALLLIFEVGIQGVREDNPSMWGNYLLWMTGLEFAIVVLMVGAIIAFGQYIEQPHAAALSLLVCEVLLVLVPFPPILCFRGKAIEYLREDRRGISKAYLGALVIFYATGVAGFLTLIRL